MSRKSSVYFGDPLLALTDNLADGDSCSGRINRAAERYMEILKRHGLKLTEDEGVILRAGVPGFGSWLLPHAIGDLADLVAANKVLDLAGSPVFDRKRQALVAKLRDAPFADLVAEVEKLGL